MNKSLCVLIYNRKYTYILHKITIINVNDEEVLDILEASEQSKEMSLVEQKQK